MTSDDKIAEYLVQEARDAGSRITAFMLADERMVATGVAVLALAATVAIANGQRALLIGLPFAYAMFFTFVQYMHAEILSLGGYKAALEEAIADRLGGVPVMAWDSRVAPSRHGSKAGTASRWLILLLYTGTVCAAGYEAWTTRQHGSWAAGHLTLVIVLAAGATAFSLVAWTVARRSVLQEYERVRSFARGELVDKWTRIDPSRPAS